MKVSNDTKKSALYIRVSTVYQIDKDSLPVQKQDLINYSKYVLGIDKYEIFEDAGYSAKNTDRPSYQQMMSRIRTGEFSHLVVWKIDRISRNLLDFAEMYNEIKKLGVIFVSKNEQFDTSSAMGEAMLKIILVFAELERNMTSERVSAVLLSRANNGLWNGGKIPFGYNYDKATNVFSINEKEAEIVRMIYDKYLELHSLTRLAKFLNEKGLITRSGNPWNPTTVSIILKNPFYIGNYRYNYYDESSGNVNRAMTKSPKDWILVENHHVKIIEPELQDKCLDELSVRKRSKVSHKTYQRNNIHIFAGLLTCGACGSNMVATTDRARADGWKPSIYICSRHRRYDDCDNKYISDITLGPFVFNYIANILRVSKSFGKSTSMQTLQKKLLRGSVFDNVSGIEEIGLRELYNVLRTGINQSEIFSEKTLEKTSIKKDINNERELLMSEKRKNERALDRLKSLYLYGEEQFSDKDYIIERTKILKSIDTIDARLNELNEKNNVISLTDEEFMKKASYFILSQSLLDAREINYEKFIRSIDTKMAKDFINSICSNFCINNGKIESITFKNGIEHRFSYKE